jgi:hypothetical protein
MAQCVIDSAAEWLCHRVYWTECRTRQLAIDVSEARGNGTSQACWNVEAELVQVRESDGFQASLQIIDMTTQHTHTHTLVAHQHECNTLLASRVYSTTTTAELHIRHS